MRTKYEPLSSERKEYLRQEAERLVAGYSFRAPVEATDVLALLDEIHDLTGQVIHAGDVLGVIAQDGTDHPQRTAEQYFEDVNRGR